MANMNNYGTYSSGRKRTNFPPRKLTTHFDLESLMPDNIWNSNILSTKADKRTGNGIQQQHQNNGSISQSYSERRAKNSSKKPNNHWAESLLYDDRKATGFKYVQPKEYANGTGITILANESKKQVLPIPATKLSRETFQTSSGLAERKVLARRNQAAEERKKQEPRMRILKPGAGVPVPMILSRAKPAEPAPVTAPPLAVTVLSSQKIVSVGAPYKIACKPPILAAALDSKVVSEKMMKRAFHLLDDDFSLCEGYTAINAYLLDQASFLVVGVIGRQGVGKSTVASWLADAAHLDDRSPRFQARAASHDLASTHCTTGLDVLVSSQRLLVMDFPAVLSTGVMDATTGRGDGSAIYQNVALEMQVYAKALQFMSLAISCCHVIVVVQDDISYGAEVLRCLKVASTMGWSNVAAAAAAAQSQQLSQSPVKHQPTVIVVHNKTARAEMPPQTLRIIQSRVWSELSGCALDYCTGLGRTDVNLFTLAKQSHGKPDEDGLSELRQAVLGVSRRSFPGHADITEKTWFEYTVREWEKIRKSLLYLDYSRLYP
uniref:Protein SMG9-like n=1 Tax=Hirondellea gigas TaxID=1518452 RepID=A0A6A7FS20_9CRUS